MLSKTPRASHSACDLRFPRLCAGGEGALEGVLDALPEAGEGRAVEAEGVLPRRADGEKTERGPAADWAQVSDPRSVWSLMLYGTLCSRGPCKVDKVLGCKMRAASSGFAGWRKRANLLELCGRATLLLGHCCHWGHSWVSLDVTTFLETLRKTDQNLQSQCSCEAARIHFPLLSHVPN